METDPPIVPHDMSLRRLQEWFLETHHHGALVLDGEGKLTGVVALQDLRRVMQNESGWKDANVASVMTRSLLTAHPDESIGDALQRVALRDIGRLPVVDRDDPGLLLGIIRRQDIARAYRMAILKRADAQERVGHVAMSREAGMTFIELVVRRGSAVAGRKVRDLTLPKGVLLTTRAHGASRHLLHGDDLLEEGDVVFAIAEPDHAAELRTIFLPPAPPEAG
jgi:CIC family chloride channel protein